MSDVAPSRWKSTRRDRTTTRLKRHPVPTQGEPGVGRDRWRLRVQAAVGHRHGRQGAKDGALEGHLLWQGLGFSGLGGAVWVGNEVGGGQDLVVIVVGKVVWQIGSGRWSTREHCAGVGHFFLPLAGFTGHLLS